MLTSCADHLRLQIYNLQSQIIAVLRFQSSFKIQALSSAICQITLKYTGTWQIEFPARSQIIVPWKNIFGRK